MSEITFDSSKIVDENEVLVIDKATKAVISNKNIELAQRSHNSERLTFECPRFIEGNDMLNCNVITIHYRNEGVPDIYVVKDVKEKDENTITFTWLIELGVTRRVGKTTFSVIFEWFKNGSSEPDYTWPTKECNIISIVKTVYNSETISDEHPDIIGELQTDMKQLQSNTTEFKETTQKQAEAFALALQNMNQNKLNKAGWEAGKFLGTDESGNVLARGIPESGLTSEEVLALIEAMFEPITQEEYDALVAADAIERKPYFIPKKETT